MLRPNSKNYNILAIKINIISSINNQSSKNINKIIYFKYNMKNYLIKRFKSKFYIFNN